jgi:hypothetical protein
MKKIGYLLLGTLFLVSCKKDEKCEVTVDAFAGSYKTTSVKYKANPNDAEVDFYNFIFGNVCDRDDYITYNTNGTYNYVDAGQVCIPNNNSSGTWSLSGNVITLDAPSNTSEISNYSCGSNTITLIARNVLVQGDVMTSVIVRQ